MGFRANIVESEFPIPPFKKGVRGISSPKGIGILWLLIVTSFFSCPAFSSETQLPDNLSRLLGALEKQQDWRLDGSPQHAKSDGLFVLINGGAEIYLEYGFEQAVLANFKHQNGEALILEIYRMKDQHAAYGVYTFKTDKQAKPLAIGGQAKLSDYYLNLWQGSYVITLTAPTPGKTSQATLITAAKILSRAIEKKGEEPDLVRRFRRATAALAPPAEIKYVRGNLALSAHPTAIKNLIPIGEGVAADYETSQVYLLQFKNTAESLERYNRLRKAVRKERGPTSLRTAKKHFSFLSDENRFVLVRRKAQYLIVLQTGEAHRNSTRFTALRQAIESFR